MLRKDPEEISQEVVMYLEDGEVKDALLRRITDAIYQDREATFKDLLEIANNFLLDQLAEAEALDKSFYEKYRHLETQIRKVQTLLSGLQT